MENDVIVYEAPKAELSTRRNNYELRIGDFSTTLKRGVDFGKVPKAKTPSLWKSGAEKVLMGYNLAYDTEITDSYKDYNKGFFYYEIKATAYYDGKVVRTGVGCANTSERSFGVAGAFDSANSALKKAKKRAVVDLALTIAGLSDAFTQDIEDESNEERAKEILSDNDPITPKQIKRIFAIAAENEITAEKAKQILVSKGYASTKDIKQKDYDEVVKYIKKYNENK